jgi:hypothetical protein
LGGVGTTCSIVFGASISPHRSCKAVVDHGINPK